MISCGEGKRRNEFVEWHVAWLAEWHNFVECNICRMTQRNKLKWKVRPFWRQSICKRSRCFNVDIRWQSKSHEGSLSITLFRTAKKILLQHESRPLKKRCFGRQRHAHVFQFNLFLCAFSIFYIPHNYVIPQAVPHAIPQTHSPFYPHRISWFVLTLASVGEIEYAAMHLKRLEDAEKPIDKFTIKSWPWRNFSQTTFFVQKNFVIKHLNCSFIVYSEPDPCQLPNVDMSLRPTVTHN